MQLSLVIVPNVVDKCSLLSEHCRQNDYKLMLAVVVIVVYSPFIFLVRTKFRPRLREKLHLSYLRVVNPSKNEHCQIYKYDLLL